MQQIESHKLGTTITDHLLLCEDQCPGATGQFTRLLTELISGAKIISREVNKAGLVDIIGVTGEVNVQGEKVRKLDEFADLVFIWRMQRSGLLCAISSEENEGVIERHLDCFFRHRCQADDHGCGRGGLRSFLIDGYISFV